jgi:hypothetical protein
MGAGVDGAHVGGRQACGSISAPGQARSGDGGGPVPRRRGVAHWRRHSVRPVGACASGDVGGPRMRQGRGHVWGLRVGCAHERPLGRRDTCPAPLHQGNRREAARRRGQLQCAPTGTHRKGRRLALPRRKQRRACRSRAGAASAIGLAQGCGASALRRKCAAAQVRCGQAGGDKERRATGADGAAEGWRCSQRRGWVASAAGHPPASASHVWVAGSWISNRRVMVPGNGGLRGKPLGASKTAERACMLPARRLPPLLPCMRVGRVRRLSAAPLRSGPGQRRRASDQRSVEGGMPIMADRMCPGPPRLPQPHSQPFGTRGCWFAAGELLGGTGRRLRGHGHAPKPHVLTGGKCMQL